MHNRKIEGFLEGELVVKIGPGHLINCISSNESLIVFETQFLHLSVEILTLPAVQWVGRYCCGLSEAMRGKAIESVMCWRNRNVVC